MQLKTLPDIFSSETKVKNAKLQILKELMSLSDLLIFNNALKITFKANSHGDKLAHVLQQDPALATLMRGYEQCKRNEGKNYIFSKNLVKALAATSTDIYARHLPDKFHAYLEMPGVKDEEGDDLIGIFVEIDVDPHYGKYIHLAWVCNPSMIFLGYTSQMLRNDKSLSETYQVSFTMTDLSSGSPEQFHSYAMDGYAKTIINGIMYIASKDADLIEKVNNFDLKASKRKAQEKIYTRLPYVSVGENFDPNIYVRKGLPNDIGVSAHWRWQPCGPQRSQHKWTYIREHVRNKAH